MNALFGITINRDIYKSILSECLICHEQELLIGPVKEILWMSTIVFGHFVWLGSSVFLLVPAQLWL